MVSRSMRRYIAWPPPDELIRLVRCTQQEEPGALDDLLNALRPALLAYFAYRLSDDSAEDLTQVALFRIARAIPRIAPERADRYIRTVARNTLRTAYRRHARDSRRYAPDDFIERAESRAAIDLDVEYQELAEAIERASKATLPPPLARIVLGLLRGEPTAAIAAEQQVSPITIRTRLVRARASLRRELRVYLEPLSSGEEARDPPRLPERLRRCRGM